MKVMQVYEYLERLGGLLRNEIRSATAADLQPVQFAALHYLSICNHYSNTPLGVSDYLGLTKGTVSQSLKVLEARGLIEKSPDTRDKRQVHLQLTEAGRALLKANLPPAFMRSAAESFSAAEWEILSGLLHKLLTASQHANRLKPFGQCSGCHFNQQLAAGKFRCGLTGEALSKKQTQLICREYLAATVR